MPAFALEDSAHGGISATKVMNGEHEHTNGVAHIVDGTQSPLDPSVPKIPGGKLTAILKEDVNTKDDWVPRDPKMIRLTGRHPFNSEPPPADLMNSHITPAKLHYVRNHGPVPKVSTLSFLSMK